MPTYDYECEACDHKFEMYQPITAKPIRKCPKCGKTKVRRLIGAGAGIIFKGSGFYCTDYRSDSYKKDAKSDTAPAAASPAPASPAPAKPADKPAAGGKKDS